MAESSQVEAADAAWAAAKRRFLVPETEWLADFLGADGFAGLPTPDEVRRAFPDRHGYGTGQEDGMIHAGAMLDALAARTEAAERGAAPPAPWAAPDAAALVRGVARCCFSHSRPGFLARSVCRDDPSLCYPATSRDQITMAAFGLWRLLRSPLSAAAPAAAAAARRILAAMADFLLATVRAETGWEAPTLDGAPDPLHRCVLWGDALLPHEAARLPMVFAAAFAATGEARFAAARDRFAAEALRRSEEPVDDGAPTYALLQMQASLALLAAEVPALAPDAAPILARVAALCVPRQAAAAAKALAADHVRPAPDWRAAGGLKGPYRETWAALREVGEAAVARQFAGPLPDDDAATLAAVLRHADPDRCTGCGLFHLIEALIPPAPPPPAGNPASHGARTPEGRPPFFHLGCDEAQPPSCPACRRRPYGELVREHVAAFAAFVRERGARALVWHDMLLDRADPRWAGFVASGSPATAALAGLDAGVSSYRDTGLVEDQLSLP